MRATANQKARAKDVRDTYDAYHEAAEEHSKAWKRFMKACGAAKKAGLAVHYNQMERPNKAWCTKINSEEVK
jgi:hypothetical protein